MPSTALRAVSRHDIQRLQRRALVRRHQIENFVKGRDRRRTACSHVSMRRMEKCDTIGQIRVCGQDTENLIAGGAPHCSARFEKPRNVILQIGPNPGFPAERQQVRITAAGTGFLALVAEHRDFAFGRFWHQLRGGLFRHRYSANTAASRSPFSCVASGNNTAASPALLPPQRLHPSANYSSSTQPSTGGVSISWRSILDVLKVSRSRHNHSHFLFPRPTLFQPSFPIA